MRALSLGAVLMAMSALPLSAISQVTLAPDGSYVSGVSLEIGNFCTLSTLFNQFGYVSD